MTTKEIEDIFGQVFNNMPNPIFSRPILYGEKGNFIYEVAVTPSMFKIVNSPKSWSNARYSSPLKIFDGLFADNEGAWVTVLERQQNGEYIRRTDLDGHIDNRKEYEKFIEETL